jgi:hypothetical protein
MANLVVARSAFAQAVPSLDLPFRRRIDLSGRNCPLEHCGVHTISDIVMDDEVPTVERS